MVHVWFGTLAWPTPDTEPPVERDKMEFITVPNGRGVRYPHTDGDNGQLQDAQRLRLVQAVTEFLPNRARAHHADTSCGARPRLAENVSYSAVLPTADADFRQADYFLRLLVQHCRQLDRRIDEYQRAITIAEISGAIQRAHGIRRVMRTEQHERQTVQALIDRLERRLSFPPHGEVPSASPERQIGAR